MPKGIRAIVETDGRIETVQAVAVSSGVLITPTDKKNSIELEQQDDLKKTYVHYNIVEAGGELCQDFYKKNGIWVP